MPKQRYGRREPTHEWSQIRPLLKDPTQIQYEILRPIVLFGISPKERSVETGVSKSSLYAKANLFDQAGMASLLPPVPPPEIPKQDKRTLPPPMRQAIVDAKAEHPGLSLHEIARMCYVQFNRKPSHHTIQLVLATGPKASRTTRRFPRFDEIADPAERRRVIIRLHAEGWMPQSIAEYLGTSRQTVHTTLRRWVEEQFAGLPDKPHTRKRRALKTDLKAMNAVKRLQENPELGAYRIHTALVQQGINLSPRTCGRILALVNLFQDVLTLEYQEQPLSRFSVEWQPDEKHLRHVGNPRLYNHSYRSGQLELWPTASVEWYLILRAQPYGPRRKKKRLVFLQLPLLEDSGGTQG